MSTLRMCLIGCGHIAMTAHIPALRALVALGEDVRLIGCCDPDPARAAAAVRAAGPEVHAAGSGDVWTEYGPMLTALKPDAVLLAVPFEVEAAIAVDILRRGIPVLLEKPPGQDLRQATEMADVAVATGTLHQVAFNRRHMPLVECVQKALADDGDRVYHIDYRMYRVARDEDHFHTTAIHGIDLVAFLAGSTYMQADLLYGQNNGIQALCALENGATAQLSFCPMAGCVLERFTLTGRSATYFVDLPVWQTAGRNFFRNSFMARNLRLLAADGGGSIAKYEGGQCLYRHEGAPGPGCSPGIDPFIHSNGFYAQLQSFVRCVRTGNPARDTLPTTLAGMALMDAMARRDAHFTPA